MTNINIINLILSFFIFLVFINYLFKYLNIVDIGIGIQKDINLKGVPLSGGAYFFMALFYLIGKSSNFINLTIIAAIVVMGILSDKQIIIKPFIKLLAQIFFILVFLFLNNIFLVQETSISFIDFFLDYFLFKILFTCFCILIIINGTNFIDGVNGNVIIYSSKIYLIIYLISLNLKLDPLILNFFLSLIIISLVYILFNFLNKSFLGDSGAYLIGFLNSLIIIIFVDINNLSPIFALSLLFYLWFEVIFSFIRKIRIKKSPFYPDDAHLHILIKKNLINMIDNENVANNFTSLIIGILNLPIFIFSYYFKNNGFILGLAIVIQILIYYLIYFYINKHAPKKNNN